MVCCESSLDNMNNVDLMCARRKRKKKTAPKHRTKGIREMLKTTHVSSYFIESWSKPWAMDFRWIIRFVSSNLSYFAIECLMNISNRVNLMCTLTTKNAVSIQNGRRSQMHCKPLMLEVCLVKLAALCYGVSYGCVCEIKVDRIEHMGRRQMSKVALVVIPSRLTCHILRWSVFFECLEQ